MCGVQLGRECGPDALYRRGPIATRALHDPLLRLGPRSSGGVMTRGTHREPEKGSVEALVDMPLFHAF